MRGKALGVAAILALAGAAGVAGTLVAQEKGDAERQVRVFALGQGSYLGVFIADVSAEDVERLGLREERGVRVTGVAEDGPARDAGLQEDDVILSWNGARLESEAQLRRLLNETPGGRSATLGLFRGGSELTKTVKLGQRGGAPGVISLRSGWDEDAAAELRDRLELNREQLGDLSVRLRGIPRVMTFMSMRGGRLGVGVQGLEPQLAEYFGLGDRTGVLITTVKDDSPAAKAGLKAGDVIIAVAGEAVEGVGDVSRLLWGADAGPAEIRILRDRKERTVTVELPEAENTWPSGDGELNGFFFGPGESDADDLHVEWAEPLKEISRLRILTEPEGSIHWAPRESVVQPARRSLSI